MMRKHFIWLVMLSGCGTAGGAQIAGEGVGVSGNGHPELAGVWVRPHAATCQPGPCWGELWKFDERGRLTARAVGGVGTNLSEMLVDPSGWGIVDHVANEVWITPGVGGRFHEGFLHCLGDRVVTESFGQNIRIKVIHRTSGCTKGFYDLTLSDDGSYLPVLINGETLGTFRRPEALGGRIISFQWQHPADWKEVYCLPDGSFAGEIVCPTID